MAVTAAVSRTDPAGAVGGTNSGESVTVVAPTLRPAQIAAGPDGNVWFTTTRGPAPVGKVTPAGVVTFLPVPGIARANDIATGPDGNLWFTTGVVDQIGRMTVGGVVTMFGVPPGTQPGSIAAGPDGNLWFAGLTSIGRITPAGVTTVFTDPKLHSPQDVATGADGNLWFIQWSDSEPLGRITPVGVVTTFSSGGVTGLHGRSIVAGPDGNLWFGSAGRRVGRITTTGTITSWDLTFSSAGSVTGVANGPDGALWFSVADTGSTKRVARLTVTGVETDFVASAYEQPVGIAAGADGSLWLANDRSIGRLKTTGAYAIFRGATVRNPLTLTAGADGNIWYADKINSGIARVTPAGVVTTFSGGGILAPEGITQGPDGNVWFTTKTAIGRITPAGTTTMFAVGTTQQRAIAAGPDGNLWFTSEGSNAVGRITPAGVVTTFTAPSVSSPHSITAGPDGNLWFANPGNDTIGRITPAGVIAGYPVPAEGDAPRFITSGPDGNLWFAAQHAIGRITPAGVVTTFHGPWGLGYLSPKSIVAEADGFLYAANQETITAGIVRIAVDGSMAMVTDSALSFPYGLAIGADKNLWFADGDAANPAVGFVALGPPPPTDVRAVPGISQATVSWAAPSASPWPVIGYRVTPYFGTTAQTPSTFASTATSQVITGLVNGRAYTFAVAALRAGGVGVDGRTVELVTIGAPLAPGFPSVTPGDGAATVSWYPAPPNGSPVTGYAVTPFVGQFPMSTRTFDASSLSRVITGLTNGTTYTFQIAGLNARGTGVSATTVAVTVGAPAAPTAVSATPGAGQATVTWSAPVPNASAITGYRVTPYRNGFAQPVQVFASTATTQVVTALVPGSSYVFRVAATNGSGTGPLSAASAAITPT